MPFKNDNHMHYFITFASLFLFSFIYLTAKVLKPSDRKHKIMFRFIFVQRTAISNTQCMYGGCEKNKPVGQVEK